jgi:uncharacterized protein (TIRG00374 family)
LNNFTKNSIKFFISIGIGVFLIWFIQKDLKPEEVQFIIQSIKNTKWVHIFVLFVLGSLACIIRALRWRLLLEPMGYNPSTKVLTASIFIMYLSNLAFPRLGEVLRCSILAKYSKVPIEKSVGTMVVERLVDVLGMGIIAFLALVFELDKISILYNSLQANTTSNTNPNLKWFILSSLLLVGSIVFYFIRKTKFYAVLIEKIKGFAEGLSSIRKVKNYNLFFIYSVFIYFIYFITTYIFYLAIPGMEHLSIKSAFLVLTAGTIGVGMTQGGIGAYQILITKALELYNIPTKIGLAYSWALWLIQTVTLVLGGLLSYVYLIFRKNEQE